MSQTVTSVGKQPETKNGYISWRCIINNCESVLHISAEFCPVKNIVSDKLTVADENKLEIGIVRRITMKEKQVYRFLNRSTEIVDMKFA